LLSLGSPVAVATSYLLLGMDNMESSLPARFRFVVLVALGLGALVSCKERAAEYETGTEYISAVEREELLVKFKLWDDDFNGGMGFADSRSAATLGLDEGEMLCNYLKCYRVSGDTRWLDKVVRHFDVMAGNMEDEDGDGFKGWRTNLLSLAMVQMEPCRGNKGSGRVVVPEQRYRLYEHGRTSRRAAAIRGDSYLIEFTGPERLRVINETARDTVAQDRSYVSGGAIELMPGIRVWIEGAPVAGDKFRVRTFAGAELEHVLYDGLVAYPMAQFIALVRPDAKLRGRYGAKADEYLKLIDRHIFQKWERCWKYLDGEDGAYVATDDRSERFPGRVLPHAEYLALGRAFLVLTDAVAGDTRKWYMRRARAMARHFAMQLKAAGGGKSAAEGGRESGKAVIWSRADWDKSAPDLFSAGLAVEFVREAAAREVEFREEDLQFFAEAFLQRVWNGSLTSPRFAGRLDGKGECRDGSALMEWLCLSSADVRVFEAVLAFFMDSGRPVAMVPSILCAHQLAAGRVE